MVKRALIIGASGGIGSAFVRHYQNAGIETVALSRREHALDLCDQSSVDGVLGAVSGQFDLILCATGALQGGGSPPEKNLGAISQEAMAAQFAINSIGPALVLRHAPRLLPKDRRGVFAALSARVGSIGDNRLGGWYSYRASKAALNQIIHTASIELARTHRHSICLALHPGTVETAFTQNYPAKDKLHPDTCAAHLAQVIDRKTPKDTGTFYDWNDKAVPW